MAAPVQGVLDDFNTGALQALQARTGWNTTGKLFNGDNAGGLSTDAVPTYAVGVAGSQSNWWTASTWTDSEVWVTLGSVVTDTYLFTRLQGGSVGSGSAGTNGYQLQWTAAGGVQMASITAGSTANLALASQVPAAGDTLAVTSTGNTHEVWYKASGGSYVLLSTSSDATYPGPGFIGFDAINTGRIDAFGGGGPIPGVAVNFLRKGDRRA